MDIFEAASKLMVVKMANETYLGVLEDGKILLAIDFEEYKISHWFQSVNISELSTIELVNRGYSKRQLNRQERLEVDRCAVLMKRVKDYSMRYYENDLFVQLYKPFKE